MPGKIPYTEKDQILLDFIEKARTQGATDSVLVGLLKGRGWREEEIYAVLARHYEEQTGAEIPKPLRSTTAAKDAFLYLLAFSTLATWTITLGSMLFTLIDRWIPDPTFSRSYYGGSYETYIIASSLASILVAFPLYLIVTRIIARELTLDAQKQESPVRKWLTYIALLIAAGVMIGDLITFLTYFLRGELSARFVARCIAVIVISGGVFWYYLGSLKSTRTEVPHPRNRGTWLALCVSVALLAVLILGFHSISGPREQRILRQDRVRVQDLAALSSAINHAWENSKRILPATIDKLQTIKNDPQTNVPYEYRPQNDGQYQLCADFARDNRKPESSYPETFWQHPKGHFCYTFNPFKDTPPLFDLD